MKLCKKTISLILCLALVVTTLSFGAAAKDDDSVTAAPTVEAALQMLADDVDHSCKTTCHGDCGYSPVIIVPGIMQSQVYVQNKEGTGDLLTVDGFPIVEGMDMAFMFDTESVKQDVKKMIFPLLKAFILGRKAEFTDLVCEILDKCFYSHYFNEDGTRVYEAKVDEYWYSLEECKNRPEKSYNYAKGYSTDKNGNTLPTTKYKTEFDFIMRQVDVSSYAEKAGWDHLYYYAYSSFGDTLTIAERLNDYVQMVKDQTGHSKVNLVFISLGGTIGSTYLSEFCNPDDIDRVVFAAAAVDGSYLLSSLMNADLIFDDPRLYTSMLPDLMTIVGSEYVWLGYLLNIVIRMVPQKFLSGYLSDVAYEGIHRVLGQLMYNCPSMWALVPSAEYPKMADELIRSDVLRAKTDRYYNIQKNAANTIRRLTEEGMDIFVICGYDLPLPSILSCYAYSSDNIIQAASTSIGGTIAPYGEDLPADYTPAIDESYISPDRRVDAGTCALPDRTWFVKGQSHLTLQAALHDTIELCIQLAINKDITDAHEHNGGYKQFNGYRYTKKLQELMRDYDNLTDEQLSKVSAAKRKALEEAYANGKAELDKMNWDGEAMLEAEKAMYTAMYRAKLLVNQKTADSPYKRYDFPRQAEKVTRAWSDITTKIFGTRDFVPFV